MPLQLGRVLAQRRPRRRLTGSHERLEDRAATSRARGRSCAQASPRRGADIQGVRDNVQRRMTTTAAAPAQDQPPDRPAHPRAARGDGPVAARPGERAASRPRCSPRSSAARRARRSRSPARIADGLELSLSQLLRLDEADGVTVVRAASASPAARAQGHTYEVLTPPLPGQRAEVSVHTLAPGAATGGPGDPPMHEPGSRETRSSPRAGCSWSATASATTWPRATP